LPVDFEKQPNGEESGALVAVWQRMIARQVLDQDRRFFDQRWIGILAAEACLRRRKG
jgi:hypothetical protein